MEEKKITGDDVTALVKSEDFEQYYKKEILPRLETIEACNSKGCKQALKAFKAFVITFIAIALPSLLFFAIGTIIIAIAPMANGAGTAGSQFMANITLATIISLAILMFIITKITPVLFVAGLVTTVFMIIKASRTQDGMKKLVRKEIKPVVFSYFGNFGYCYTENYTEERINRLIKALKIYPLFATFKVDDCIKGEYNGLNLKITELNINAIRVSANVGNKSTEETSRPIFSGLMLEVDMNKKFTSHTIVKFNDTHKVSDERFQRVNFEDPEFARVFDVYSTDQIEARYLLTTVFMERLMNIQELSCCYLGVEAVFYNQKAYFFISSDVDMFELPAGSASIKDIDCYRSILLDLAKILKVVDALKLEQNIGL